MMLSGEKKLKLIIVACLALGLSLIILYHHIVTRNSGLRQSEIFLYQEGKKFEFEIKSEISKIYSVSDFMAAAVSENVERTDFVPLIKNIFREVMVKNPRLHSVELVLKANIQRNDTLNFFINFADKLSGNSFRFKKLKTGAIEESEVREFSGNKLRVAIEKAILVEQTKILVPELIREDGISQTVLPVLTSIYRGQQFLGYFIMNISTDWLIQVSSSDDNADVEYEIFVASPDNRVISLNGSKNLLAEPIEKNCLSCQRLLGDKGALFNSNYSDALLTVCIPWKIKEDEEFWHTCLRAYPGTLPPVLSQSLAFAWIMGIVIFLLTVFLVLYFFRRYSARQIHADIYMNQLLKGEEANLIPGNQPEIKNDQLFAGISKIGDLINEVQQLNTAALEGDFSKRITGDFESHPLVKSTAGLIESLQKSGETLNYKEERLLHLEKMAEGIQKLNGVLKQFHADLEQLSENVVKTLVGLLEIEMGAIFLMKSDEEGPFLELIVSYAYSESSFQKRRFKPGESLIGACAAEKRTIFLKKVPEDYLKIISGLGLTSPKSILIVPLVFEGRVLGVIELGSIRDFDGFKMEFVEKSTETIANTLSMAEINIHTSKLLEKTRQQTVELEERDMKMLDALNKLKDIQSKTAKSESAMRAKLDAMDNTLMVVEYTTKGILLDANFKYLNTMGYSLEDIKGIDVLDLLKEEDKPELIKIINTVKNGNFYEGIIRRPTRHGADKWLLATYTPVYNGQNVVESILFFAVDISRIKNNEEQLRKKALELTLQVDEMRKQMERKS
jgi:PAS domain S-box-containing protein